MAYSDVILSDSPAAYYRLNETSGNPQDSSGNANHATSVGGTPSYSQVGALANTTDTAIAFDGATEWVGVPDHLTLDLADTFTLEAWIKTNRAAGPGENWGIVGKDTGAYYMRVYETGQLELLRAGIADIVWSDVAVDDGIWHHVVATKIGATVNLYVDGNDETGSVSNSTCADNTAGLTIGGSTASVELFLGTIDEVAVYPTALSAARVQAHYAAGIGIPSFVGAGAGANRLTAGSVTVSKTGCTAGNLVAFDMQCRGTTGDWGGFTNRVNVQDLAGTAGELEFETNSIDRQLAWGVVTANGTVSADVTVGASGEDIIARIYEFEGGFSGRTLPQPKANVAYILENGSGVDASVSATSSTVSDAEVVTRGPNRLALTFVAIKEAVGIGSFQGQTGGTWVEAIAEYNGATQTLQLQAALMPTKGTIDGGTASIGSSQTWEAIGTALKPYADPQPQGVGIHGIGWLS